MTTSARLVRVWLDRQVRVGYESGIWHSMILHCVVLLCLALVWDHGSADHRQPIVIAFASQGSEEELGEEELETLVELDELPVMPEAADEAMVFTSFDRGPGGGRFPSQYESSLLTVWTTTT